MKLLRLIPALLLAAVLWTSAAQAQGCGPSNPNCIVPTAPAGTSDNRAASTAFVQNAVGTIPYGNITGLPAMTILGSIGGGSASALTPSQVTTFCNVFSTSLSGCVPFPGSATGKVLSDNGTWIVAGGSVSILAGSGIGATGTCSGSPINCTIAAVYSPIWTSAVAYNQSALNANTVYMTDFMGASRCDGTLFVGGTGGVASTSLVVTAVSAGTLAVGQTIGGTGVTAGTTIIAQASGTPGGVGTYTLSGNATIAAGAIMQGGTDQATNIQAFLNQVAANGVNGFRSVTGVFASGNCFVSASSPTITINSSAYPVNYHLIGYGSQITPDPSRILTAFKVVRGTFLTHGDESRTLTIEGLTVSARNNANAAWGFDVADSRVYLIRNNCYAGDDQGTAPHNQGNFACFYYHQIDATDPNTGAFYGKIIGNVCKGTGTSTSAVPVCVRFDGAINAMVVAENAFAQGTYALRIVNPCATVNANCAYLANGLSIVNNYIENFSTCINVQTNVPTLSQLVGGEITHNTFEACSLSVLDIATLTQASATTPLTLGPNTYVGNGSIVSNPNAVPINIEDHVVVQATVNFTAQAANTTTALTSFTALNTTTSYFCSVRIQGDTLGIVPSCYISGANTVTIRAANPTSGSITLGSKLVRFDIRPSY